METAGGSPTGSAPGGQTLLQIQTQVALQQDRLLRQEQQVTQLQAQLLEASTRLVRAEETRNLVLCMAAKKEEGLVDSTGVGQPFKLSGKSDQDFAEWQHKFKAFMKAKYGEEVERVLSWTQSSGRPLSRRTGLMAYLVSFTTLEANKVEQWGRRIGGVETLEQ